MKRLVIYLAVTFGLSWGVLIPAGIALGAFEHGEASTPAMMGIIGASMFFPLVGAIISNLACRPEDRIDLCWKPRIKGNVRHYLAAWFGTVAIAIAGSALFFALNPQLFDPTMQSYIEEAAAASGLPIDQIQAAAPQGAMIVGLIVFSVLVAPLINMIPAFGEELGWRGMLFPTLLSRMSPRAAALVSGVIWGLWHAPVIAMGHNYGMGYQGFPIAGVLTMILACTALGAFLSYLRMKSESVWPCALAHGAFNAVANLGLLVCTAGASVFGPSPLALIAGIPVFALGAICLLRLPRA